MIIPYAKVFQAKLFSYMFIVLTSVCLLIGCCMFVGRIFTLIKYDVADGVVLKVIEVAESGKVASFKRVEYSVSSKKYYVLGFHYSSDGIKLGDKIPVLYDSDNPRESIVYTANDIWWPPLLYVIHSICAALLAFAFQWAGRCFSHADEDKATLS